MRVVALLLLTFLLAGCTQIEYTLYEKQAIDSEGNIVQEWEYYIFDAKDGMLAGSKDRKGGVIYWNGTPILETNVVVHHDASFTPDGNIIFLSHEKIDYNNRQTDFDYFVKLSLAGDELERWSTYEHLDDLQRLHKRSPLEEPAIIYETCDLTKKRNCTGYYHINSVQEIPENNAGKKDSRFRAGNWLVSDRTYSLVFVIDQKTKNVVWVLPEHFGVLKQHMPRMLPSGNILIFDNRDKNQTSRVIEINPLTEEIVWEYLGEPPESFFTPFNGGAQRLKNGNTLITESKERRIFEVNQKKEIVWEFIDATNMTKSIYRALRVHS